jgi:hypothetical protein
MEEMHAPLSSSAKRKWTPQPQMGTAYAFPIGEHCHGQKKANKIKSYKAQP